jgi:hypothetical protein
MGYTISLEQIIDYGPAKMRDFFIYEYEYIDNRQFALTPKTVLGTEEKAMPYIDEAKRLFLEEGWHGDGDVELLWLPPFVFPLALNIAPVGVVIWHVKQEEDGISYLLSPIALPFDEFAYSNTSK